MAQPHQEKQTGPRRTPRSKSRDMRLGSGEITTYGYPLFIPTEKLTLWKSRTTNERLSGILTRLNIALDQRAFFTIRARVTHRGRRRRLPGLGQLALKIGFTIHIRVSLFAIRVATAPVPVPRLAL